MRRYQMKIKASATSPARDSYLIEIVPVTKELYDEFIKPLTMKYSYDKKPIAPIEFEMSDLRHGNTEIGLIIFPDGRRIREREYRIGETPSCDGLIYFDTIP